MQPVLIICGFLFLVTVGVMSTPPPGGLFPLNDGDNKSVEAAKKMILNTMQEQAKSQDSNHETIITLDNIETKSQVVAGTLYHFTYDALYEYKCLPGSKCENKASETKKCHAVIFEDLHQNPLSYHEEPNCK